MKHTINGVKTQWTTSTETASIKKNDKYNIGDI
jgi:hypothetical protein